MKKAAPRLLTVILSICLTLVMAVPASAQTVRKESTYNSQGFVATLICDSEHYTCNIGSTSSYVLKTKSECYYTISVGVYTTEGPATMQTTYSIEPRESNAQTGYVSDGWGIWDVAKKNPGRTVRMQSAACSYYVNNIQQFQLKAYP